MFFLSIKMQNIFILFTLISFFSFQDGFAAEIDSVTPRKLKLDNSLSIINTIINQRIEEGVQKANAQQYTIEDSGDFEDEFSEELEFCDEEALYTELRKAIYQSYTASWGLKGYDLDKQYVSY